MKLLRLEVRRSASSEPHVERLPCWQPSVSDREDLDVLRLRLQELSQRFAETGEKTLLTSAAAEKLLRRQICTQTQRWAEETATTGPPGAHVCLPGLTVQPDGGGVF